MNNSEISINNLKNTFINVSFVDDAQMLELNMKYKNKDYPTDVLSFNIDERMADGRYYLGDVVVNVEQAQRQSSEYGNDLKHEIAELVEHGVLHLMGVHHEHDE